MKSQRHYGSSQRESYRNPLNFKCLASYLGMNPDYFNKLKINR
jgi:hypothetical protein